MAPLDGASLDHHGIIFEIGIWMIVQGHRVWRLIRFWVSVLIMVGNIRKNSSAKGSSTESRFILPRPRKLPPRSQARVEQKDLILQQGQEAAEGAIVPNLGPQTPQGGH